MREIYFYRPLNKMVKICLEQRGEKKRGGGGGKTIVCRGKGILEGVDDGVKNECNECQKCNKTGLSVSVVS